MLIRTVSSIFTSTIVMIVGMGTVQQRRWRNNNRWEWTIGKPTSISHDQSQSRLWSSPTTLFGSRFIWCRKSSQLRLVKSATIPTIISKSCRKFSAQSHTLKKPSIPSNLMGILRDTLHPPIKDLSDRTTKIESPLYSIFPNRSTVWTLKKLLILGFLMGTGELTVLTFWGITYISLSHNKNGTYQSICSFPHDIAAALQQGFDKCEQMYVTHSKESKVDKSGSCAIVTFFYGDRCYIANVGDSRAIMSSKNGKVIS